MNSGLLRFLLLVLALGYSISSFTTLRFLEGVGVSEGLILVFSTLLLVVNWQNFLGIFSYTPFGYFWAVSFVLLLLGFMYSTLSGVYDESSVRDFVAYLFSFYAILALGGLSYDQFQFFVRSLVRLFLFVTCFLILYGLGDISGGVRYSGLSENPNQLALFCLVAIGVALLDYQIRRRPESIALSLSALVLGWATRSDAFNLAVVFGGGGFFLLMLLFGLGKRMFFYKILLIVLGAGALSVKMYVEGGVLEYVDKLVFEGDQGSIRYRLWENGWEPVMMSPLVGFGPGAWSGLTAPFQGAEAHNVFIDWANSSGLLGIFSFLVCIYWLARRYFLSRNFALLGFVAAVLFFGVFHFVFRQPTFWMCLVLMALYLTHRRDIFSRGEDAPSSGRN